MKNILKSIGAVLAGFITVVLLSVLTDLVLEKGGFFPPQDKPELYTDGLLLIATAYRTLYTVAGGWVAARLAPAKPMAHAVWLGVLGMVVGTLGAVVQWKLGHNWYPIVLVVEAIPCTAAGAWLFRRSKRD